MGHTRFHQPPAGPASTSYGGISSSTCKLWLLRLWRCCHGFLHHSPDVGESPQESDEGKITHTPYLVHLVQHKTCAQGPSPVRCIDQHHSLLTVPGFGVSKITCVGEFLKDGGTYRNLVGEIHKSLKEFQKGPYELALLLVKPLHQCLHKSIFNCTCKGN